MMRPSIDFARVSNLHAGLIDITSLTLLVEISDRLIELTPPVHERERLVLDVLSRMIVYDYLVVDSIAFTAHERPLTGSLLPFNELLLFTEIPTNIYASVASQLARLSSHSLLNIDTDLSGIDFGIERSSPEFAYMHRLPRVEDFPSSLLYTNPSSSLVARTLFYLAVADHASIPVFLHSSKYRAFGGFRNKLRNDVLDRFQTDILSNMSPSSGVIDLSLPPLSQYILTQINRRGRSIFDVVTELRQTPEARAFRELLWRITDAARLGGAAFLNAQHELNEINRVAREWGTRGEVDYQTKYRAHTLRLSSLPVIGWILDLFNHGDLETALAPNRDAQTRYLNFIANWFRDHPGPNTCEPKSGADSEKDA